jgi:hypothetical protein
MNFFARVLQQPDTGRYCNENNAWVPEASATGDCSDSVDLDFTAGRKYNTTWDNQYIFDVRNIGHFWDKYFAILAITDSNAFFFRDFSSLVNRGAFNIGYYRVFQPEMLKLFGGLITGDTSVHTPTLSFDGDGNPVVEPLPFLTTDIYGQPIDVPPPDGDPIQPSASYRLRRWSAMVAVVNLSSTFDQTLDFAARTRIAIAGSPHDPAYDPSIIQGTQIVTFTHPASHVEYRAAQLDGADGSIGFNILTEAQAFSEGEYADAETELAAAQTSGDAARLTAARTRMAKAEAVLDEKLEVIEWMIVLGDIFEFPGG